MSKDISVEEGNKLIAEFMGIIIHDKWSEYLDKTYFEPQREDTSPFTGKPDAKTATKLKEADEKHKWNPKYHSSWDWLMPVVEKIVHVACELPTVELRKEARKRYDLIEDQLCNFIVSGVHLYSVQFIQWYNSTLKQKK